MQSQTVQLNFTFDGSEKKNRLWMLTLKSSSKNLPDNCNEGWWWAFFCFSGHWHLIYWMPSRLWGCGVSAGANGPIPQAKCYSRRWWKNCVGLFLLSTPCRTIMGWWDLSITDKKSCLQRTYTYECSINSFSQKMQIMMHGGNDTQERWLYNIQT